MYSDTKLASAYALVMLGINQREEMDVEEYYENVYDLDLEEFIGLFDNMIDFQDTINYEDGLNMALVLYELGRRHEQYSKDMAWIGGE